MSAWILCLITLLVVGAIVISICLSCGREEDAQEVLSGGEDQRYKESNDEVGDKHSGTISGAESMEEIPSDDGCAPGDDITANGMAAEKFQLYGACAHRGTAVVDWLRAGSELQVEVSGDSVRALRGGRVVGIFPDDQAERYRAPDRRYKKVVVVDDVNLNDKYGQCFVRPKY